MTLDHAPYSLNPIFLSKPQCLNTKLIKRKLQTSLRRYTHIRLAALITHVDTNKSLNTRVKTQNKISHISNNKTLTSFNSKFQTLSPKKQNHFTNPDAWFSYVGIRGELLEVRGLRNCGICVSGREVWRVFGCGGLRVCSFRILGVVRAAKLDTELGRCV